MSRSGYTDEDCYDTWGMIRWRGAVRSAIRGKRGQAFLTEMLTALDTMEVKRLIKEDLARGGEVCAMGAVGLARGIDMSGIDPEDYHSVAGTFGISEALVQEISYLNDERGPHLEPPEARYQRMRRWIEVEIKA